jgi:hypothetical protein
VCQQTRNKNILFCTNEYSINYHFEDTTIEKMYIISSGLKKNGKKIGKWTNVRGYYNNEINKRVYYQYFIHDYEIVADDFITKNIEVNVNKNTAFCNFIYFYEKKDTVQLTINYWLKNNKIYAKCITTTGKELFCTNINYLDEEFKLLFTGIYNRKIYIPH